jgi:hypothetical protein
MDGELGDYSWSIQRHADDIQPGDRAALWVGGKKSPGLYAVGTVTGAPFTDVADGSGWQRAEDRGRTMLFCPIEFDTVLLDSPIARSDLKADPRFERSRILTQPWAANPFLLADEEWQAIADRLPRRFKVAPDGEVVDLRPTRAGRERRPGQGGA